MQQRISPTASAPPTLGDMLDDIVPVLATVFVAGPPVLVAWAGGPYARADARRAVRIARDADCRAGRGGGPRHAAGAYSRRRTCSSATSVGTGYVRRPVHERRASRSITASHHMSAHPDPTRTPRSFRPSARAPAFGGLRVLGSTANADDVVQETRGCADKAPITPARSDAVSVSPPPRLDSRWRPIHGTRPLDARARRKEGRAPAEPGASASSTPA